MMHESVRHTHKHDFPKNRQKDGQCLSKENKIKRGTEGLKISSHIDFQYLFDITFTMFGELM